MFKQHSAILKRILIVGGDSRLGAALCVALREVGATVTTTTRRLDKRGSGALCLAPFLAPFLDLLDLKSIDEIDLKAYDIAYLCAGVSGFAVCEEDESARQANVTNTLHLCERLRDAGCALVFLSTSAVFDGNEPQVCEDALTSPTTAYGQQKAEVEGELLSMNGGQRARAAVVRLSKVLTPDAPIILDWRRQLQQEFDIHPLSDLWLSPISLHYAVQGLIALGQAEQGGVFHLSGECDVSYADCALALATRWGLPTHRVQPHSLRHAAISVAFQPAHPTLGMARTTRLTGLAPQSFAACMDEVAL